MRCTGCKVADLPEDLSRHFQYVRLPASDSLLACMATLVQAAQGQGLMRRIEYRHTFWELSKVHLNQMDRSNPGVVAVEEAGSATAAAVRDGCFHGARMYTYASGSARMAAHQDVGTCSAHSYLFSARSVFMPACAIKLT